MSIGRAKAVLKVVLNGQSGQRRIGRNQQVIGPLAADLIVIGLVAEEHTRGAAVAAAGSGQGYDGRHHPSGAHRQQIAVQRDLELTSLDRDLQVVRSGRVKRERISAIRHNRIHVQTHHLHLPGALQLDPKAGIRAAEEIVAACVGLAAKEQAGFGDVALAVGGDGQVGGKIEVLSQVLAEVRWVGGGIGVGRQLNPAVVLAGIL